MSAKGRLNEEQTATVWDDSEHLIGVEANQKKSRTSGHVVSTVHGGGTNVSRQFKFVDHCFEES